MPRAQKNKTYSTFVKGRVTEAGPLTFPENAMIDEENCDLSIKGNVKRRLPIDLEDGGALSSATVALATWAPYSIASNRWNTVGGDGNLNFLVLQIGDTLHFYDLSSDPISDGKKSFTVDLTTFTAAGATEVEKAIVQVDNGKGLFFVSGVKIESFYIEYDADTDTITSTQITVKIRDFEGLDDGLEPDEQDVSANMSIEHEYNLMNQGWVPIGSGSNALTGYLAAGRYPPNSKPFFVGNDTAGDFKVAQFDKVVSGNTLAPKGHYIVDAFFLDRSAVSGVVGLDVESVVNRPSSVAFFAGRVFWAGTTGSKVNGNVYFNQILEGTTNIGKCYQMNDSTSEDMNQLLSTDGGVIIIPEIGRVLKLFSMKASLMILADNGVWAIAGGQEGAPFKATNFSVSKVSSVDIEGIESIVDVEGTPLWWSKTGISTIIQDEVTFQFSVKNLTKDVIQSYYEDIPALSKTDCKGIYDQATKKIFWLYRETAQTDGEDRYRFNKVLIFDTRLGAFYSYKLSEFDTLPYYVGGAFSTSSLNVTIETSNVLDGVDLVVDSSDQVVFSDPVVLGSSTFVKFLVFNEGATNATWGFGSFRGTTFMDWYSTDSTGVAYTSFFETGNELMEDVQRDKQTTYIQVYFNRTETAYVDTEYGSFVNPSGCLMQAKWEWSDNTSSAKFSPQVQVYRFVRKHKDTLLDGTGVIFDDLAQVFDEGIYVPDSGTDFDSGFPVTISKNKIRGVGKTIRLRFESQEGKDFDLLGWAIVFTGGTAV